MAGNQPKVVFSPIGYVVCVVHGLFLTVVGQEHQRLRRKRRYFLHAVILHLHIRVAPANREAFLAYIAEAFPVFEAHGDCLGALYVDAADPTRYDEVFYYLDEAAF